MLCASLALLGLSITSILGAQSVNDSTGVLSGPDVQRYRAALRFGANGDLRRARDELAAVLRSDPTHASAKLRLRTLDDVASGVIISMTAVHLFRAAEDSDDGRHTAALAEIDSGIALSLTYDEAFRLRGRTRIQLHEFQPAIQDYTRAISLNPRNSAAFLNRGIAFLHIRDLDNALNDFNSAIELEPLNADLYVNRGTVYVHQARLAEAFADFQRGIDLDPGAAPAYANKAFLYENVERWDEALKTYKALVRNARPGYPQLLEHAKRRIRDLEGH
jgi:tetratricopeptide (TPR) repeat protein